MILLWNELLLRLMKMVCRMVLLLLLLLKMHMVVHELGMAEGMQRMRKHSGQSCRSPQW